MYVTENYDWTREHFCRGCWYYRRCGKIRFFLCHIKRTLKVLFRSRKKDK